MTSGPTAQPAHPGHQRVLLRQKGMPVADDRYSTAPPDSSIDRATDPASTTAATPADGSTHRLPRAVTDTLTTTTGTTTDPAHDGIDKDVARELAESMPLSVWRTAQTSPAAQRKGRYVAES